MEKNKKELRYFFGLTFIITWILWTPSILNAKGYVIPNVFLILSMMASFTPSIIGLFMWYKSSGKNDFKSELKSRLTFKFNKLWLLVLMTVFPFVAWLSLILSQMMAPEIDIKHQFPLIMTPLVFLQILVIGGAIGEEFGWRGFALKRLQLIFNPFTATLILGFLWSLWHLPLFFMVGTVQSTMPIWQFMIQNTLIAFFYTSVFNQTKGNLVLMILLHAIANTASAVFPYWQSDTGRYISFVLLLITLLIFQRIKLPHSEK